MKKPFRYFAVLVCSIFSINVAAEDPYSKYTEESRKIAQEFMQKLGGTLKQQLESSGTESAIKVCKEVAPALAKQYSTTDRVVKRVSLKPRNQSLGTPSDVERDALQSFDESQAAGREMAMEVGTVYEDASGKWFHYMRAIPTQPQCLQCHGQVGDISDSVKALLASEYPNDQATGYSAGQIRGAISIKHKIQ